MNAAAIAGSGDANGDSGHDSDEGWKGQGTAAEAGGGMRTGLRARLHWELRGTMGGGECEVAFWLTPLPCLYRTFLSSRRVLSPFFRYFERIWPFWPSCSTKKM